MSSRNAARGSGGLVAWATALAAVVGALLTQGCGSKSGLEVPDSGVDATMSVEDAAVPDAMTDAALPCIELLPDGGPVEVSLATLAEIGRADVVFLIDTTASMDEEIDGIRSELRDGIVPAVNREIPDAQFAVATFADFPVSPYGEGGDLPYTLMLPMSPDVGRVQAAMDAIQLGNGRDEPESQVEALYLLATGEGLPTYVPPSLGCPSGGFGSPCFRADALPIILLFTDAPMHNGPLFAETYDDDALGVRSHTYPEARDALRLLGARVIGFDSGDVRDGEDDLRILATDTDTLDESGQPLVFDIGQRGERLSAGIVDALKTFAGAVVFDVDAFPTDPVPGDGVDATRFIASIEPLRAEPADGVQSIDRAAGVFRGVTTGTSVFFRLEIRADAVTPGPTTQRYVVEIVFRGDGRTRLGSELVEIVIPGLDGEGCEDAGMP